jgi:flagellar biosynthesis protein FlhB
MADQGQGQQTEKPTKRKLDKARKEGQFPSSREFLAALQFLTFVVLVTMDGRDLLDRLREMARYFLEAAFRIQLSPHSVAGLYRASVGHVFMPLLRMGVCLTGVALVGQLGCTRLGFAFQKLAPDLKRLSPLQKIKNTSAQNSALLLQAIVFLPLIALAVYGIASEHLAAYASLAQQGIVPALLVVAGSLKTLLWRAAFLFLVIGSLDFLRVYRRHNKSLRMSKQEIREEFKETEGNPQIKGRIRKIQRDLARRNMMKEIPQATAVIVNPTHYSVAIRYEMESMAAPRVLAKGKNYLARRIREIAMDHQVPIIENEPLAQALYKSADVGQEIPPHLYRAVAEVLAYIFKLMNARRT